MQNMITPKYRCYERKGYTIPLSQLNEQQLSVAVRDYTYGMQYVSYSKKLECQVQFGDVNQYDALSDGGICVDFLFGEPNPRGPRHFIDSQENLNDTLNNRVLLRQEYAKNAVVDTRYINYPTNYSAFILMNIDRFHDYRKTFQGPTYHEVIYYKRHQKIVFDIDMPFERRDDKKAHNILKNIKESILKAVNFLYKNIFNTQQQGFHVNKEDLFILESCGADNGGYKYGYHILVKPEQLYLSNGAEAKLLCNTVQTFVDGDNWKYIDGICWKNLFMLRTMYSSKNGRTLLLKDNQYKGIDTVKELLELSLVSNVNPKDSNTIELISDEGRENYIEHKRQFKDLKRQNKLLNYDDTIVNKVLEYLETDKLLDGFEYKNIEGPYMQFKRMRPSFCGICNVAHQKENSMFVYLFKPDDENDDSIIPIVKCRRSHFHVIGNKKQSISLKKIVLSDVNNNGETQRIPNLKSKIAINNYQKYYKEQEPYMKKLKAFNSSLIINTNEQELGELPHHETLFVKSQMGTGKTKSLMNYIRTYFKPTSERPYQRRILIVSFRQTFTAEIVNKLSTNLSGDGFDFKSYKELPKGPITHPQVVIQFESLHRIKMVEQFDLVILDESESIIGQITSGLGHNLHMSLCGFSDAIKNATNVVCLDAGLSERTLDVISLIKYGQSVLKQDMQEMNIRVLINNHKSNNKTIFIHTICTIRHALIESITNNEKVVICTNSLEEARMLDQLIKCQFPNKNILSFNSQTDQVTKDKCFSDPNTQMIGDVLIYTPTITAGISIEVQHYDKIYCIFNDSSCNADQCVQMMGRVRSIASKEIHMHCQYNYKELEIKPQLIAESFDTVYEAVTQLEKNKGFSYFKLVWQHNEAIDNMTRNDMLSRLLILLQQDNIQIIDRVLTKKEKIKGTLSIRKQIKMNDAIRISDAKDITAKEENELRDMLPEQLTQQEKDQLEKSKIKKIFEIKQVSAQFVYENNRQQKIKHIKNVKAVADLGIRNCFIINDLQSQMQERIKQLKDHYESNKYIYSNEQIQGETHQNEIKIIQKMGIHHQIQILLTYMGFDNIFDQRIYSNYQNEKMIHANDRNLEDVRRVSSNIVKILKINPKCYQNINRDKVTFEDLAKFMDHILSHIYGISFSYDANNSHIETYSDHNVLRIMKHRKDNLQGIRNGYMVEFEL